MDNTLGVDVVVSIDNLIHQWDGVCLGNRALAGDLFSEVAPIAKLSDDVGIVFCVIDVINFDYVFAVPEGFKDLDLGSEQIFVYLSFDHSHVNNFDCNGFIWGYSMSTRGVVPPSEHLAAVSFSNMLTKQIAIILQFFPHCTRLVSSPHRNY